MDEHEQMQKQLINDIIMRLRVELSKMEKEIDKLKDRLKKLSDILISK